MKKIALSLLVFVLAGCGEIIPEQNVVEGEGTTDVRIEVVSPVPNETITSPFPVSGKARGSWFFEAIAPILVVDWDGRILAEGRIQTTDNWMTEDFVNFTGTIVFEVPDDIAYRRGTIIFQRSNPSALPENDAAVEIPVVFAAP